MKYVHYLVLAALGALLGGTAAGQSAMQPGGWQMKMKISKENPVSGESKSADETVSKMCLTKDFLSRDPYFSPKVDKENMEQKGAKCVVSDEKRSANLASWRMRCEMIDGNALDLTVSNSASARKFNSDIRQIIKRGSNVGLVKITLTSTYIGKCTKEMLEL